MWSESFKVMHVSEMVSLRIDRSGLKQLQWRFFSEEPKCVTNGNPRGNRFRPENLDDFWQKHTVNSMVSIARSVCLSRLLFVSQKERL